MQPALPSAASSPAQGEITKARAGQHHGRSECGVTDLGGLHRQREQDDARGVRHGELDQHLDPVPARDLHVGQRRHDQPGRRAGQQHRVQGAVPGTEQSGQAQADRHGQRPGQQRPRHTPSQARAHCRVAQWDVRPGDEHDQRESDLRHEAEGFVGRVQRLEAGLPQHQPHQQFTDHDRKAAVAGHCEQRPNQGHQTDQSERRKRHRARLTKSPVSPAPDGDRAGGTDAWRGPPPPAFRGTRPAATPSATGHAPATRSGLPRS